MRRKKLTKCFSATNASNCIASKVLGEKGIDGVMMRMVATKVYAPIVTMKYGFSVNNGKMTTKPIKIAYPSSFQLQAIKLLR